MPFVIGLDVGSSSIKGGLLDLDAHAIVAAVTRAFPAPLSGPSGRHEVDSDDVVERCRAVIDELVAGEVGVEAVLICGQHGGFVPFDRSSRRAIGPFISWRDERTGERDASDQSFFDGLLESLGEEALLSIGRELAPGGTLALVAWLDRHRELPRGAVPLGIGEYVLCRLAADAEPQIERTCAVGMIDVRTMQSPRALYERLGLAGVAWPRIVQFHERAGLVAMGGRRVPVFPVVGDHQCALAGALLGERELSINVSTGSQVALLAREPMPSPRYQTRAYFDGLTLNTLTHLPAGRALNVFVELLTELPRRAGVPIDHPWAILGALLENEAATDLRVRTTLFKGPLGERGAIENISVNNLTAASLMRAAIDDMAANYREAATRIASDNQWDELALSGGIAQKLQPLRSALKREFAGRSMRVSTSDEETLQGLLALSLVATGRAASLAVANAQLRRSADSTAALNNTHQGK